ncbi:hypothetical protein V9T40_002653 [Parthenolecanium corni]|uniref:Uncharacterized protein n=1 Tax=Parthenolecanium corni TaxID=536013 RepID=A0AAN9TJ97_9HEMI
MTGVTSLLWSFLVDHEQSVVLCHYSYINKLVVTTHFSSGGLNFRLDVSIFDRISHFSSGCLNFRLDVSTFGWMSQMREPDKK